MKKLIAFLFLFGASVPLHASGFLGGGSSAATTISSATVSNVNGPVIPYINSSNVLTGSAQDMYYDATNKRVGFGVTSGLSYDLEITRTRNGEPVGVYSKNLHSGGDAVFCNANDVGGSVCMGIGGSGFPAPYSGNQFFTSSGNIYFLPVSNSTVAVVAADLATTTVGKTLKIATGTNGKHGTFALSSGAAFVANTSITANSVIIPTMKTISGTATTVTISSTTVGGGFNAAGAATDNSTYNYAILEAF